MKGWDSSRSPLPRHTLGACFQPYSLKSGKKDGILDAVDSSLVYS